MKKNIQTTEPVDPAIIPTLRPGDLINGTYIGYAGPPSNVGSADMIIGDQRNVTNLAGKADFKLGIHSENGPIAIGYGPGQTGNHNYLLIGNEASPETATKGTFNICVGKECGTYITEQRFCIIITDAPTEEDKNPPSDYFYHVDHDAKFLQESKNISNFLKSYEELECPIDQREYVVGMILYLRAHPNDYINYRGSKWNVSRAVVNEPLPEWYKNEQTVGFHTNYDGIESYHPSEKGFEAVANALKSPQMQNIFIGEKAGKSMSISFYLQNAVAIIKKWKINQTVLAEKMNMPVSTFKNKLNQNLRMYSFSDEEQLRLFAVLKELHKEFDDLLAIL